MRFLLIRHIYFHTSASCEKNVGEAYEQWQKDLKITAEKNTWMRQFLESLDSMEHDDMTEENIER